MLETIRSKALFYTDNYSTLLTLLIRIQDHAANGDRHSQRGNLKLFFVTKAMIANRCL